MAIDICMFDELDKSMLIVVFLFESPNLLPAETLEIPLSWKPCYTTNVARLQYHQETIDRGSRSDGGRPYNLSSRLEPGFSILGKLWS